ncbi:MAG TPA: peptidoglycan bridge formation glycyltransferase FemA/FemB family protein [Candidatus Acidoferrum sp.]
MNAESCTNLVVQSIQECPPASPSASDSLTVKEAELREWDLFLARTGGGSYPQTSSWAMAKLMAGFRTRRFTINNGDVILGGAQMLYRRLPLGGTIAYVPLGPVLASDDSEIVNLAIAHLHRIARQEKVSFLAVQPPRGGNAFARRLQNLGFSPALLDLAPTASALIDLSNSLDVILSRMRKTTRYDIRASQRKGITIRDGRPEDLDVFYKLLLATARRQAFSTLEKDYLHEVWQQFSRGGHIKMFIAELEGTVVSAALMMTFGDTVTYWKGAWSGKHGNRYPNEALQWAVIQWAKSQGYRYYDFGGINRAFAKNTLAGDTSKPRHSVGFYKLGFGGQIELFPEAFIYFYNPTLRRLWSAISRREREQALLRTMLDRIR